VNADLYILDSGPLGLVTNPQSSADGLRCNAWLFDTLATGARVVMADISDFEIRRELIRAGKARGLARLDHLAAKLGVLPIDRDVWHRAAALWAQARKQGKPTAAPAALDGDVILAAVAQLAAEDGTTVIVVTDNNGHLGQYVDARDWRTLDTIYHKLN
jgi:predicted nucleic acid-binding protein